jgi:hypothetical protein
VGVVNPARGDLVPVARFGRRNQRFKLLIGLATKDESEPKHYLVGVKDGAAAPNHSVYAKIPPEVRQKFEEIPADGRRKAGHLLR